MRLSVCPYAIMIVSLRCQGTPRLVSGDRLSWTTYTAGKPSAFASKLSPRVNTKQTYLPFLRYSWCHKAIPCVVVWVRCGSKRSPLCNTSFWSTCCASTTRRLNFGMLMSLCFYPCVLMLICVYPYASRRMSLCYYECVLILKFNRNPLGFLSNN